MTDAQDVHENFFDEMLADWNETWGNENPDYPFMLDDGGVPDSVIDPALLNESARLPTYPNASASVPSGATDQQALVKENMRASAEDRLSDEELIGQMVYVFFFLGAGALAPSFVRCWR